MPRAAWVCNKPDYLKCCTLNFPLEKGGNWATVHIQYIYLFSSSSFYIPIFSSYKLELSKVSWTGQNCFHLMSSITQIIWAGKNKIKEQGMLVALLKSPQELSCSLMSTLEVKLAKVRRATSGLESSNPTSLTPFIPVSGHLPLLISSAIHSSQNCRHKIALPCCWSLHFATLCWNMSAPGGWPIMIGNTILFSFLTLLISPFSTVTHDLGYCKTNGVGLI